MVSVENLIEKLFKFLIITFPLLLISGPFLPDLACVLIGLFYLIIKIKDKDFSDLKKKIIIFLIFFFLYINFNSLFSFDPFVSFSSTLPYLRIILFVLGSAYLISKYSDIKYLFFYLSLFSYFVLVFDSSFQFFTGKNLIGIELKNNSRISSFFGDEYIMGSFVSRLLPILMGLSYLIKTNQNLKIIRFLLVIISLILVIYSGERLASIYLIFTITLYFYLDFSKKQIIIFFIITGSIFLFFPKQHNTFVNRIFVHSYNQYKETDNILKFSYRHYLHYYTSYKMYLDNKLLGQGVKSFRFLCNQDKFSVVETIIKDNIIYADKEVKVLFKELNNVHIEMKLLKNNMVNQNKNIQSFIIPKKDILKKYVKNNSVVKKDEPIISFYEFKDGCNTHPHSFYFQFLSELGLIGLLFLITSFIYAFYNLMKIIFKKFKNKINNVEIFNAFFYLGIFINLFPVLPSGNFFNNWLLLMIHLPLAFYIASNKENLGYFKKL